MSYLGRSLGTIALAVLTLTFVSAPAQAQINAIKDGWLVTKIHSEFVDEDVLSGSNTVATGATLNLGVTLGGGVFYGVYPGQAECGIDVRTALEKTVDRAVIRERRVSSRADVERRWRWRYIPSQQFYFATVRPTDHVDIIVHNDEPQQPVWEARTH